MVSVELTFLICRIDLFDLAGTRVDMYSKPDSAQRLHSWVFVFQTVHATAPC